MEPKREFDDQLESVKKEIMHLVQAYDNGLSEMELSRTMSSTSVEIRMNAINALTNEGKVQLCKRGSDLIYRVIDSKAFSNHSAILSSSNISVEERAVYQVVESSGSKGMWNREIRNRTRLPMSQMTKILKNLETKKLIKAVKSVTASKRKLYMLYGLEPDRSVTGGAWYSGTEFESEYVQVLHEQCYQFIKRKLSQTPGDTITDFIEMNEKQFVSSSQVKSYIDNLKISKIPLSLEDIEMILETIVFDGLIEKISVRKRKETSGDEPATVAGVKYEKTPVSDDEESEASDIQYHYRAIRKVVEHTGVTRAPCSQCPYVHECRPNAVISPEKCLYFERWLSS